jgi:hypothetical protein
LKIRLAYTSSNGNDKKLTINVVSLGGQSKLIYLFISAAEPFNGNTPLDVNITPSMTKYHFIII